MYSLAGHSQQYCSHIRSIGRYGILCTRAPLAFSLSCKENKFMALRSLEEYNEQRAYIVEALPISYSLTLFFFFVVFIIFLAISKSGIEKRTIFNQTYYIGTYTSNYYLIPISIVIVVRLYGRFLYKSSIYLYQYSILWCY